MSKRHKPARVPGPRHRPSRIHGYVADPAAPLIVPNWHNFGVSIGSVTAIPLTRSVMPLQIMDEHTTAHRHPHSGPVRVHALKEDNDNDTKSLKNMVEPSGLEPLTSTLPVLRSTN